MNSIIIPTTAAARQSSYPVERDMFDILLPAGRDTLVTAGVKGIGAAAATRLREGGATVLTAGWGRPGDPGLQRLFVAADITAADGLAVSGDAFSVVGDRKAEIGKLATKRDLGPQVEPDTGITAGDHVTRNLMAQFVGAVAVGLAVFTTSLMAFIALFAWWILVLEPSPAVQPPAQISMPLFPQGYRPPAHEHRS